MIVKTRAIVLKKIPYGESSFVVHLFTEALGRQSVIVRGVRNPKSKVKAALFQPMTVLNCEFNFKESQSLHSLKEVRVDFPFQQIYSRIEKNAVVMFMCEILSKTLREEGPQPDLFLFLRQILIHLDDENTQVANLPLFFLLRLLPYLGFKPGDNFSSQTPYFNIREGVFMPVFTTETDTVNKDATVILWLLMQADHRNYQAVKMPKSTREYLVQKIADYYAIHVNNFGSLKTIPVLHDVLNS